MQYRREIDGLRSVAIIPVVLFHSGFPLFSGGYVGVDVFFVISGFLITRIMIDEIANERFSLINFYERRTRRIIPALFVMLIVTFPIAWFLMNPSEFEDFVDSWLSVPFFISNFIFANQFGYFGSDAHEAPLLHTWSLAVEEQFYILFPLFLLFMQRFPSKNLKLVLLCLVVSGVLLSEWGWRYEPTRNFFLTPFRAWELLVGSICAVVAKEKSSTPSNGLSALGLGMIFIAIVFFDYQTPMPSVFALLPVIGAALVLMYGSEKGVAGKILTMPLMIFIGLISYSAYLWHQPVIAFVNLHLDKKPSLEISLILIALIFMIAWVSWRYIEQPFRINKSDAGFTQIQIFRWSVVTAALIVSIGVLLKTTPLHQSYYLATLSASEKSALAFIEEHTNKRVIEVMRDDGECKIWISDTKTFPNDRLDQCKNKYGKALVVLGDSHAMNLFNMAAHRANKPFILGFVQPGCRPGSSSRRCQYDYFLDFLERERKIVREFWFHQSGSHLLKDYQGKNDTREIFDPLKPATLDNENLAATIAYLRQVSQLVEVKWYGPFAEARVDLQDVRGLLKSEYGFPVYHDTLFTWLDTYILDRLKQEKLDIHYISLVEAFDLSESGLRIGDCLVFSDQDHLSPCGEDIFSAKIPIMVEIKR